MMGTGRVPRRMGARRALDLLHGLALQAARSRHGEQEEVETAYESLGDVLDGLEESGYEDVDDE